MDVDIEERSLVCPKCRQPIEGDDPYVCCAGATLQWRCADCGKVSEGFASPYGMCPLCSGKLEMLDAPRDRGCRRARRDPHGVRDPARRPGVLRPRRSPGGGAG